MPKESPSGSKLGHSASMGHARRCAPWKAERICVASRSVGSRVARDQTWLRSRSPTATRACCGRYLPRVKVIEQRRFPPASPKLVEGTAGGKRQLPTRDCAGGFSDDGDPVRPALSKPELRRGSRGHTSDEVESARIPSGPGVPKCPPAKGRINLSNRFSAPRDSLAPRLGP
jgi:hypothetical protein